MTFGAVLRSLRTEYDLTQRQLADALGVSESRVGMYERGKREPDFEMLEAIADYFNVDMDYLTGRSKKQRRVTIKPIDARCSLSPGLQELVESYEQLNDEGREDLRRYARVMVLSGEYSQRPLDIVDKDA